ncbi:matrilin-2-like [Mytilus galloprovincialis]|uniref:matrilin-2-like n=1 Tax=Mytilus galloprovincialis TaxID=29158 RepID=UPI003F7BBAC3
MERLTNGFTYAILLIIFSVIISSDEVNAVLKTTPPALVLTTTTEIPQRPTVNNKTCGQSEIDIVIMLDSSTSVGNDNYTKMTNFCKAFLKHADIDSGNIRVGVLSYSTFVHVEFHLNDCNTTPDIMEAIGAIRYRSGATNTADGLKIMRTQMFTAPNGDRNGVTNKLLILTDGVSNINPLNTIPEAEQARADGIHIYTIGIGLKDNQELYAMVSVPAAENSFSLQDFDELAGLSDSLFNDICLVPSDSTAAVPATELTTTLKLAQRPTRNKNNREDTKDLGMLNTLSHFVISRENMNSIETTPNMSNISHLIKRW